MEPAPLTYVSRTLAFHDAGTPRALAVWSPRERQDHAITWDDTNAALHRITDRLTITGTGRAAIGLGTHTPLARLADGLTYARARFELDPEKEEVEEAPTGSKLGGVPNWVQHDDEHQAKFLSQSA